MIDELDTNNNSIYNLPSSVKTQLCYDQATKEYYIQRYP